MSRKLYISCSEFLFFQNLRKKLQYIIIFNDLIWCCRDLPTYSVEVHYYDAVLSMKKSANGM
jgi:hypothetical protein